MKQVFFLVKLSVDSSSIDFPTFRRSEQFVCMYKHGVDIVTILVTLHIRCVSGPIIGI